MLKLYHVSVTPVVAPKGLDCVVGLLVSATSYIHQVFVSTVCDINRTHVKNKFVLKYR